MSQKITPLFILGGPRNGTTWLGNSLAKIDAAFCPQHELHYGFHESNVLRYKKYYKNIEKTDDYISFLEDYSSSDFFKLAQGDKEYFYKNSQKSFIVFFLELMDNYCKKHNKKYWITKLDPMFFLYPRELENFMRILEKRYDKVKYIAIKRDFRDYFSSYLHMEGRNSTRRLKIFFFPLTLIFGAARYIVYYNKIEDLLLENADSFYLDFDSLKNNHRPSLKKIADFLNIEDDGWISEPDIYKPNTSFLEKKKIKLSTFTKISLEIIMTVFRILPILAVCFLKIYEFIKRDKRPGYRKILKSKYFNAEFKEELEKKQAYQIKDAL